MVCQKLEHTNVGGPCDCVAITQVAGITTDMECVELAYVMSGGQVLIPF